MKNSDEFVKVWRERQFKKGYRKQDKSKKSLLESHEPLTEQVNDKRASDEVIKRLNDEGDGQFKELDHEEIKKERKHLKTQKTAKRVIKHSGTFIFILSLAATIIILFPFIGVGTKKPTVKNNNVPTIKVESEDIEAKVIKEATALGLDARYSLYVPKINAKSVVIENVDMGKEAEYLKALQKGVAHGKGTYFPGQGGNIFLFSHSVSVPEYIKTYNAVFYDLKDLEIGDEIIIYFSGTKYIYKVSELIITSPRDVSFLTKDYGGETLILQTCDPPGTTLRRLLVIAKLV